MTLPRLVPVLLLRGTGLSKSERFRRWRYVGDPVNAIRIFNEKEVDELVLLDVDATRERREPRWALLEECAGECFMPLSYGGGITTLEQAKRVVGLGIEKVVMNAAAWANPGLVTAVAGAVGSCSTVVCLDVKRDWRGRPGRYQHEVGRRVRADVVEEAQRAVDAGAGELILQDVDRDGTFEGPDLALVRQVCAAVSVPVTVLGGVGSLEDASASWRAGASGVSAGSWFVFQRAHRAVLITYPRYGKIREAWQSSREP